MTSKAVVTGGAGFIGSHIVDELINRGIETFVIDNLTTGSLENLKQHDNNKLLHLIIGDARNIAKMLSDVNHIDVLFHEAAIVSVPRSIAEPMIVHDVNVNMTLEVLNFCIARKIKRFIFASSAAVYGIIDGMPASENLVCKPYSPYGASKLAIEDYLHAYQASYGIETIMLRYFNVFGPRQKVNDYSGVITVFTNKLLRNESPIIFGDGEQVRDFIHVKDIVLANMLAMESKKLSGEVFNVATGNSTSVLQLFNMLKEITGSYNIDHLKEPARSGDVKFGLAATEKIKTMLGFRPTITIQDGLSELVDYFKSRNGLQILNQ